MISGAAIAAYNGSHTITRTGEDAFSIPVDYVGGGTITAHSGGLGTTPLTITSAGHGLATGDRIRVSNAGVLAYNGEYSVTTVDVDRFQIGVEVRAANGGLGRWAPAPGGAWKHASAAIQAAANGTPEENDAQAAALGIKVDGYSDTRGEDAIAAVVGAIVDAASDSGATSPDGLTSSLIEVGVEALASRVVRYPLQEMAPTGDYSAFIRAADAEPGETRLFPESAAVAAAAAAQAAFDERESNPLKTSTIAALQAQLAEAVENKALAAAARALEKVFGAAARANRTELPMRGTFAVGSGDATLRAKLGPGEDLGQPGLTGVVILPAMHPTNPFRHRRHPDHTVGFDIVRKLRFDFDGEPDDPLDRAGFGVSRITGTFREEITKPANRKQGGLHKPLGPNQDRGLIVEGTFELSRISMIDTLNAK